jgi:hypothetical protein
MKRRFVTLALIVVAFLLGWFAHRAYSSDPHNGVQWQFVAAAERGDLASTQQYFPRVRASMPCPLATVALCLVSWLCWKLLGRVARTPSSGCLPTEPTLT